MNDEPEEEIIKLAPDLFSFNIKIYKPKNEQQFFVTRYICHIEDFLDNSSLGANSSGNGYPTVNLGKLEEIKFYYYYLFLIKLSKIKKILICIYRISL